MENQDRILDTPSILESNSINFKRASKEKRFINYIVDLLGFYAFAILIGVCYALLVETSYGLVNDSDTLSGSRALDYLISALLLISYYTAMEYLLKGKSIGKYVTRTRAVTEGNRQLSITNALARSFGRIIPFEQFSFFGDNGWHDSISKTKVIEDVDWNGVEL